MKSLLFSKLILLSIGFLFYSGSNIQHYKHVSQPKDGVFIMSVFGDFLNAVNPLRLLNPATNPITQGIVQGIQGSNGPSQDTGHSPISNPGTYQPIDPNQYLYAQYGGGYGPNPASTDSGGSGSATVPDVTNQVQGDQNTLQNLYNQLYGGIDKQVQDQTGRLQNQYNQQFDTANKAQSDALARNDNIFTGRGAYNSSYRENAANDLNNTYNQDISNMGQAEQNALAGLGKYATTAKASLDASKPQFDLSQYTDLPSLQALHQQLTQHIGGLQQQLSGLGTNQDYLNTVNNIVPIQSQAATQLSGKLATLANSSAAPEAKDALAQGYISQAQLSDPNAKNYWTSYFQDLLKKSAPTSQVV